MRWAQLGALLVVAVNAPCFAQSCGAQQEYDAIAAVVTEKFYDRSFAGLPWPARVAQHRGEVHCGDDVARVALAANALLAELHASHTAVYTRADVDYWALHAIFSQGKSDFRVAFSGILPARIDGQ